MAKGNPSWIAGAESPNPGGRPQTLQEFRALAIALAPKALLKMNGMLDDPTTKQEIIIRIIEIIFDRAYGKPTQDFSGSWDVIVKLPPDCRPLTIDDQIKGIPSAADFERQSKERGQLE
jgi:hypothetical protein